MTSQTTCVICGGSDPRCHVGNGGAAACYGAPAAIPHDWLRHCVTPDGTGVIYIPRHEPPAKPHPKSSSFIVDEARAGRFATAGYKPAPQAKAATVRRNANGIGDGDDGDSATASAATTTAPSFEPFPVDVLPRSVREFVTETADAIGCDPSFVALPVLPVLGAAIGTTRVVEVKKSWTEPPIVWACIVARSGSMKTPPWEKAIEPLVIAQREAFAEYETALAEYHVAKARHEKDLAAWKKSKEGDDDPPEAPIPPEPRRHLVADATVEAVAPILSHNPRGVLLGRDELAGWVRGFNQYKGGKGGDVANWLEMWRAGMVTVDRKTGDRRIIHVPRAAVSVCGTIQPGVLATVLTTELFESGLAARLLLAQPPDRVKRWSERYPAHATIERYHFMVRELLKLKHGDGEHGPEPVRLPMTPGARERWKLWYNRHARRIADAGDDARSAALAKIEAYAVRFALIFTLADDPAATHVDSGPLERGIRLADWFAGESERVYLMFAESDDDRDLRKLREWIERRGGAATVRDVTHGLRGYRNDPEAAEMMLDRLVRAGDGRWAIVAPGPRGGQPTKRFELVTRVTVTETPIGKAENRGNGDGDGGDGADG